MFQFQTLDSMWTDALTRTFSNLQLQNSRCGNTYEVLGYQAELQADACNFLLNSRRRLNPYYACAEILWHLSGEAYIDRIKAYAPKYGRFVDSTGLAYGAYGPRMPDLLTIVDLLRKNPDSRRAVVVIWDQTRDLEQALIDRLDIPCGVAWQFILRDSALHMICTMRSNDIWFAMPYDIFANTTIQRLLAGQLKVNCGKYIHQVGSLHIYEKNWEAAQEALAQSTHISETHNWHNLHHQLEDWSIKEALKYETAAHKQQIMPVVPSNRIFYDLAITCAHKWDSLVLPRSPILKRAIYAYNRRN